MEEAQSDLRAPHRDAQEHGDVADQTRAHPHHHAQGEDARRHAERLVTYAKKSDQRHGMNLAARIVREQGALRKLLEVIGPRLRDAQRRYTRVLRWCSAARRRGADVCHRVRGPRRELRAQTAAVRS